jgi:hypothetical protein
MRLGPGRVGMVVRQHAPYLRQPSTIGQRSEVESEGDHPRDRDQAKLAVGLKDRQVAFHVPGREVLLAGISHKAGMPGLQRL